MSFTRTFHSVGQGAFYTEYHRLNDDEFNIVYDCGSISLKQKERNQKIISVFQENQTIDILFISHFHKDHINGIKFLKKYCKIKNVVIPYLDKNAKVLIKSRNLVESDSIETSLIDSPDTFFDEETRVIIVKPVELNNSNDNINTDGEDGIDLSTLNSGRKIEVDSGTTLRLDKRLAWLYIPFNYNHQEVKQKFLDELKKYKITVSDIDNIEKIYDKKNIIAKAFRGIYYDLNITSLVLFSGSISHKFYIKCLYHKSYYFDVYRYIWVYEVLAGCLYCGDFNFKAEKYRKDMNERLKKLFDYVGTIQIPHHGSRHNFHEEIIKDSMKIGVISFGKNNSYGHPSSRVIERIIMNECYPISVTEEQDSELIQIII